MFWFGYNGCINQKKKKKKKKKKTQLWQPRKHERDRRENNINDRKNKKEMAKVFDIPARS
jgi:hypothetical protein